MSVKEFKYLTMNHKEIYNVINIIDNILASNEDEKIIFEKIKKINEDFDKIIKTNFLIDEKLIISILKDKNKHLGYYLHFHKKIYQKKLILNKLITLYGQNPSDFNFNATKTVLFDITVELYNYTSSKDNFLGAFEGIDLNEDEKKQAIEELIKLF